MAPLPAGLNVSGSSLSPGQLQLVLTNAYGTNITSIMLNQWLSRIHSNLKRVGRIDPELADEFSVGRCKPRPTVRRWASAPTG